jgi:hypothetical protein
MVPADDHDGGGAVTGFNVLTRREIDEHPIQHVKYMKTSFFKIIISFEIEMYLAAGWTTLMVLRMVAPSLVMTTSPLGD